jgi:hypothetical protein
LVDAHGQNQIHEVPALQPKILAKKGGQQGLTLAPCGTAEQMHASFLLRCRTENQITFIFTTATG